MLKEILVTGGYGFIGSHFIRNAIANNYKIINIDKITYAANPLVISEFSNLPNLKNYKVDISHFDKLTNIFNKYSPIAVINFAAETHVDNSINDGNPFLQSNIIGTYNLLKLSFDHWRKSAIKEFKFIQISTDEVFGSLTDIGKFNELSPINPRNPYSASKASADHFVTPFKIHMDFLLS